MPTDDKITALPAAAAAQATELIAVVQDVPTVPEIRKAVFGRGIASGIATLDANAKVDKWVTGRARGLASNPQALYTQRAQIVMFRTDAAITITRIHIHGSDTTPTTELAGDLKFADDINIGGFANATIIDVCDTTNGVVTITEGFDDATVPANKYVYFQMDASPHADWKDFYIEVQYTYD